MEYLKDNATYPPSDHILIVKKLLLHDMYQRPYQYLSKFMQQKNLDDFKYENPINNAFECLQTLLKYCSVEDPSWSELSHFSKFLNTQLQDCENSVYCNQDLAGEYSRLAGLKNFAVKFMIRMSQDFATPSLNTEAQAFKKSENENNMFELHQLRQHWETEFHPYLFFNSDRISMSFVHFNIDKKGNLCHPKTNKIVLPNVMHHKLVSTLKRKYKVNLNQDFDHLDREKKLETLFNVLDVKQKSKIFDPDPTYELTTDNVLKMLAIQMRFRCGIPVVMMGETGCGKTRMIEFMSKLKAGHNNKIKNMFVVKVHGGITVSMIQKHVEAAESLAKQNGDIETTLFLDEANTTEAIYAIKEIVCDLSVCGKSFFETGLQIVAACNPYRKHEKQALDLMEKSGLGFHVKTESVTETFAGIPMRQLVYRVVELPPSMQPLIWDFGQLSNDTEIAYIKQMVLKLKKNINSHSQLENLKPEMVEVITNCLHHSHVYIKKKRDVCSFVSLRDVERTIKIFKWFYTKLKVLDKYACKKLKRTKQLSLPYRALIHALGVCYHVTLDDRKPYRECIAKQLQRNCNITEQDILDEIIDCQNLFFNSVVLESDIGRNEALRENVFMMIVCAEMRIPLFLVGKPGSSKSLAKTTVANAMQGRNSKIAFFKELKQIHVSSFQCSAVSDAVGIERVFNQCAMLQKNEKLDDFVAVVVLDEIGLAEDSPKMPLKVLHSLLENSSIDPQFVSEEHCKVGFVGISNWALDPAKMNRGIFVTHGKPSKNDLEKTAEAIFESDKGKFQYLSGVIKALTSAYLEVYESQTKEFFGLRDYYALLKMLYHFISKNNQILFTNIFRLVVRNFSGSQKNVLEVFQKHLDNCFDYTDNPYVPVVSLIQENLNSVFESRFLLLLTNQYSAVGLLPKVMGDISDYQVVFGSSFPSDNDYTEVCRNINKIKICMETGQTVVLLNLRNLYESLYDALNQHYVTFADQRYVDLGLGGHRVKCRIAPKFHLIIIEEKQIVYNEFPIPLINRLEKHVLEMSSILTHDQLDLVNHLKDWLQHFTDTYKALHCKSFFKEDVFPGYKEDTVASALLSTKSGDIIDIKKVLIQTASLDSICRLSKSELIGEADILQDIYFNQQEHNSLLALLQKQLMSDNKLCVFEVTSFSQMLIEKDCQELQKLLQLNSNAVMLLTLQQFRTEREFSERLDKFFTAVTQKPKTPFILLVQCPQAHLNGNLIACAKYAMLNKIKEFQQRNFSYSKVIVIFVLTMERHIAPHKSKASFSSFHSSNCSSMYIDELKPSRKYIAPVRRLWKMTIPQIVDFAVQDNELSNEVLNVKELINVCIPFAMAKLQNKNDLQGRNRVKILSDLCFNLPTISTVFLRLLVNNVNKLLSDQEHQKTDEDCWLVHVACSGQDLQEGGSFKNGVWLFLRNKFAIAVAKIIAGADVDCNLNLLRNKELVDLWLQMFESGYFVNMQWPSTSICDSFLVQVQPNFDCSFPFSRFLYEMMLKQWMIITAQDFDNVKEQFFNHLCNKPIPFLEIAAERTNNKSLIQLFIIDFVYFIYQTNGFGNHISELEMKTVQSCVFILFQKQKNFVTNCNAFAKIFVLLQEIKKDLQLFSGMININLDILKNHTEWTNKQSNFEEFIIHKLAFCSLLEKLDKDAADHIGSVESCEKWKTIVNKAKVVADTIVPILDDKFKQLWNQISFVEMFLEQLIPTSSTSETAQHYLMCLAPQAKRLWKAAKKLNGLSSLKFLNIFIKTLHGSKKSIEVSILCNWHHIKCKSCNAHPMSEPVKLSCKHYICFKCISPDVSERACPHCRQQIPEETFIEPLKLSSEQENELSRFHIACSSFFLEFLSTFYFGRSANNAEPSIDSDELKLILEKLIICDNSFAFHTSLVAGLSGFDLNINVRSYILQLSLQCNASIVEDCLKHYLDMETISTSKKSDLIEIYMLCLQNILNAVPIDKDIDDKIDIFKYEIGKAGILLDECCKTHDSSFSQLQHLEFCVKLQYVVRVVVLCINKIHHQKISSIKLYQTTKNLVTKVANVCQNPLFSGMKLYIIKLFCHFYGLNAFHVLLKDEAWIYPAQDSNQHFYLESDYLVFSGESYVKIKSTLLHISKQEDFPQTFQNIVHEIQQSKHSFFQVILALSVWTANSAVRSQLKQKAYNYIVKQFKTHFSGKISFQIFDDIAKRKINDLVPGNDISFEWSYRLVELLSIFGATVFWHEENLLSEFSNLILNPKQFNKAFLPTMPASNFFLVKDIMKQDKWCGVESKAFLCPNGHPYFIGDSIKPYQSGVCPECCQPIGGKAFDVLHHGNRAGEITEESQAGYKLYRSNMDQPIVPERKLSKLSVCVLRISLHAAMLLASKTGNHIQK